MAWTIALELAQKQQAVVSVVADIHVDHANETEIQELLHNIAKVSPLLEQA